MTLLGQDKGSTKFEGIRYIWLRIKMKRNGKVHDTGLYLRNENKSNHVSYEKSVFGSHAASSF